MATEQSSYSVEDTQKYIKRIMKYSRLTSKTKFKIAELYDDLTFINTKHTLDLVGKLVADDVHLLTDKEIRMLKRSVALKWPLIFFFVAIFVISTFMRTWIDNQNALIGLLIAQIISIFFVFFVVLDNMDNKLRLRNN